MATLLFTHPSFVEHDTGFGHPERPERIDVLLGSLSVEEVQRAATVEELERCHTPAHVARIRNTRTTTWLDPDGPPPVMT